VQIKLALFIVFFTFSTSHTCDLPTIEPGKYTQNEEKLILTKAKEDCNNWVKEQKQSKPWYKGLFDWF